MKWLAVLLGLVSSVGEIRADCGPTNPFILESDAILVGEIVDYRRVPLTQEDYGCYTTTADGYPDPNTLPNGWCDGIGAYDGYATIRVVDALKGDEAGEVGVLVRGIAINGEWYTTDFSPGQRYILGLRGNTLTRSRNSDHVRFTMEYRIRGFHRFPGPGRPGDCVEALAEASEANVETLRAALNRVPFSQSLTDDSLRELPGDEPGEGACWIKQRKGTDWKKVEIPCQ